VGREKKKRSGDQNLLGTIREYPLIMRVRGEKKRRGAEGTGWGSGKESQGKTWAWQEAPGKGATIQKKKGKKNRGGNQTSLRETENEDIRFQP